MQSHMEWQTLTAYSEKINCWAKWALFPEPVTYCRNHNQSYYHWGGSGNVELLLIMKATELLMRLCSVKPQEQLHTEYS